MFAFKRQDKRYCIIKQFIFNTLKLAYQYLKRSIVANT